MKCHGDAHRLAGGLQHLPGDCGLGEITANLVGEEFEGSTASLSFCKSFPAAATEITRAMLFLISRYC